MALYALISALLLVANSNAACTREQLKGASDTFFSTAFSNSKAAGLILSPRVKITQNNQILPNLAATAHGNLTAFAKTYQINVIDTETCNIVTLAITDEKKSPAIVSLRLKLAVEAGDVEEVEILNAMKGSHALFNVSGFPEKEEKIWSEKENKLARANLVEVGNSYADGIQSGDDTIIQAGPECPRFENGVKTTAHCNRNMTLFVWPVRDRRWYADTDTGVAVGSFNFAYKEGKGLMNKNGMRPSNGTTSLWLHEYFKIVDGKIVYVTAAMQTLGADYVDVWRNATAAR